MKIARIASLLIAGALIQSTTAAYADTWHTSKIKNVSGAGVSDKYHYIRPGQFGMTTEGVRMLAATALMAHAAEKSVSILFDETSSSCYINRLLTRN